MLAVFSNGSTLECKVERAHDYASSSDKKVIHIYQGDGVTRNNKGITDSKVNTKSTKDNAESTKDNTKGSKDNSGTSQIPKTETHLLLKVRI